jgi:hypothetical protein
MEEDRRNALLEFYRGGWEICPGKREFMIILPGRRYCSQVSIRTDIDNSSRGHPLSEDEDITIDFYSLICGYLNKNRGQTPARIHEWCTKPIRRESRSCGRDAA